MPEVRRNTRSHVVRFEQRGVELDGAFDGFERDVEIARGLRLGEAKDHLWIPGPAGDQLFDHTQHVELFLARFGPVAKAAPSVAVARVEG